MMISRRPVDSRNAPRRPDAAPEPFIALASLAWLDRGTRDKIDRDIALAAAREHVAWAIRDGQEPRTVLAALGELGASTLGVGRGTGWAAVVLALARAYADPQHFVSKGGAIREGGETRRRAA
jgi:hypothetical protein